MRNVRLHCKRTSLWMILILQIVLITCYFLLQSENSEPLEHNLKTSVSFIKTFDNSPSEIKIAYHTISDRLKLNTLATNDIFIDFNSSLCFKMGTDFKLMQRSKSAVWNCNCLPGWHGSDCGQPEVVWRALLAHRKPVHIKGPRKYQRRVVYLLEVNEYSITTTDIRINDLNWCVDLFVLYENETSDYFHHKLRNNFLKDYHQKILYIKYSVLHHLWKSVKSVITNLRDDDLIIVGGANDMPNGLALQFFKLYDKWPQPLKFRYRWSVYGFFWLHPSRTILKGGGSTALYLYESLNDNIQSLYEGKTVNFSNVELIIGDLNHFGGWFCEYCYDSLQIIEYLKMKQINIVDETKKIDNSYIEDLIENGIYINGKTELMRTHRFQENYFAPPFVVNNSWKYDWLLINLYSKMDYY